MNTLNGSHCSIILPAKNEAQALHELLPRLCAVLPGAEILLIDDGSTDQTAAIGAASQVCVLSHPSSLGNGAAVKTGARTATRDILVFMDADGQHQPEDIPRLLHKLEQGFEMVVGARTSESQAGMHRTLANAIYNKLA